MNELSFIVEAQVNKKCFANTLSDSECFIYDFIDSYFIHKNKLKHINILSCLVQEYKEELMKTVNEIV